MRFWHCLFSRSTSIPSERSTVGRRCRRAAHSPAQPLVMHTVSPRDSDLTIPAFGNVYPVASGAAAENVAYGCATEDCVIRMWARSSRHRANMLRRDVTRYGIASADGVNGKRYWVLELGN